MFWDELLRFISSTIITTTTTTQSDYKSGRFPLLILRWVTISMAVLDFGLRRIFWQLSKINFDDGEVLSIQKIDFNEL
ncbi:unnamed protein product [Rhizophagus irregularis]|nr:unnamed protein product [Rhizophagus irregularis]